MSEHEYEGEEFVNSDIEGQSLEPKPKPDQRNDRDRANHDYSMNNGSKSPMDRGINTFDRNIPSHNRQSSGRFKDQVLTPTILV